MFTPPLKHDDRRPNTFGRVCCSALVKGRQQGFQSVGSICRYNFIDITCALGIALLINVGVLLVSASTFFSTGSHKLFLKVDFSSFSQFFFCGKYLLRLWTIFQAKMTFWSFLNINLKTH